jgi:type IV pilus assembly protein PilW
MRRAMPSKPGRAHPSRGFSLVELMVAIVLGLFLLIGLISLLVSNVRNRSELDKSVRQIENGRYAVQQLSEDFQHAGYFGAPALTDFAAVLPTACPTTVASLGYAPQTSPGTSTMPLPVYALAAAPACISNVKAGSALLVVSRVSTTPTTTAAKVAAETYLQVSNCMNDMLPFKIGTGAAGSFDLTQKDCTTPELLRKVVQHIYFVSPCNDCANDTTPTLKMAEYVDGAMSVVPLVEGIENLQLDYGIDLDSDGAPDCYLSNPGNPPVAEIAACPIVAPAYVWTNAKTNWTNVMTARVHVLARNPEPSGGWTDDRSYDMGMGTGTVGPFNDAYKRHAYSAVVRLNNSSGQREQP